MFKKERTEKLFANHITLLYLTFRNSLNGINIATSIPQLLWIPTANFLKKSLKLWTFLRFPCLTRSFTLWTISYNYKCILFDSSFTPIELFSMIKKLKIRFSPGINQIDYNFIPKLPLKYFMIFLNLYNEL